MTHPLVLALVGVYAIIALLTLVFQLRRREAIGPRWGRICRYAVWTVLWFLYWPVQHGLTDTWLMLRDALPGRRKDQAGRS